MKNLLRYFIKKRFFVTSVITIICLVIATISLDSMRFVSKGNYYDNVTGEYLYEIMVPDSTPLDMIAIFAAILVLVIPIFEFYFKMRKINIDQMYSLPVKRYKIFVAKYIVGLAEIIIPITITYIYSIIWVACSKHMFDMIYFLPYYFVLIGITIMAYTSISFIYTRANTFFDGIILIFLYMFILPFLFFFIDNLIETDLWSYSFIYSPFFSMTNLFNGLLKHKALLTTPKYEFYFSWYMIYAVILNFITSVALGFLFFYLNPKDKAENAFEKSNSKFAYKTIIPIITCLTTIAFAENTDYIVPILVAIMSYILLVVYHRSFKVPWKELIIMTGIIIISVAISILFKELDPSISINNNIISPK